MMKEMEMKRVPKLRFPEFTDDWEQRKLLSCIQKITDFRGRTPKKLGMDWSESGYLALSALNVKDGYIDFSQDVHYGDQVLYDKWMSGNELHKGQVLFTTEAPMGNVAQVPDNKRYILSQRTIAFDVKADIITENFLAIVLRSSTVFNTLTSLSSGGTAKGVSQKSLAGVDVQIPSDLREQTLLAEYFRHLDYLITLHQRKLEKLKKLRKGMMQRLFSQEIRFKADDGSGFPEWEEKKVGSLGDIVGGGTPSTKKKEYWCGKIAWVSSADIGDNDIRNINITRFITREAIADSATKIIPKDSILIVSRVGVGKVAKASCNLCTSQDFTNIVNLDGDVTFLSYAVLRLMQSKLQCVQGTSIKGIPNDEIKNYTLNIPCLAEQQKIANCLSSLDGVIEKQKAILAAWEELKKGLLQQMFV